MSSRHLRKALGQHNLPTPDDSDDDYQPLYAKNGSSKFTYDGLELSSDSEKGRESPDPDSAEEEEPAPTPGPSKKRNRRKQKKAQQSAKTADDAEDEIDKSIKEINAMMGAPLSACASNSEEKPEQNLISEILIIQPKLLNVSNELKKKFGDEGSEERSKRGNRQAQLRIQKKSMIISTIDYNTFYKNGLSMSVQRREGGYIYYAFDHNEEYQRRHQRFLHAVFTGLLYEAHAEEALRTQHVEAMLQSADAMFRMEEYTTANKMIERSIAYMQYVAHPSFQLSDPRTRLEYKYVENRTFHVAILKYIHLLTNRACHRTALELAKVLLNLDPSDPLAVLLIIDVLALRAREHQWLIDAFDRWSEERNAGFLFNMQFSYALAHFHVATKNKEDLSKSDELLQTAMLRFPLVVAKIFECANVPATVSLQTHVLFQKHAEEKTTRHLKDLIVLYAKLIWYKWRENAVFEWFQRNARELTEKFDRDPAVQKRAQGFASQGLSLFRSWPNEVARHLYIIKPMASLIVDGAVPRVTSLVSADPLPPSVVVNRCNYTYEPPVDALLSEPSLRDLFTSMMPNYAAYAPPNLEAAVLEHVRNNPGLAMMLTHTRYLPNEDDDDFDVNFAVDEAEGNNLFESAGALMRTVQAVMDSHENAGRAPGEADDGERRVTNT